MFIGSPSLHNIFFILLDVVLIAPVPFTGFNLTLERDNRKRAQFEQGQNILGSGAKQRAGTFTGFLVLNYNLWDLMRDAFARQLHKFAGKQVAFNLVTALFQLCLSNAYRFQRHCLPLLFEFEVVPRFKRRIVSVFCAFLHFALYAVIVLFITGDKPGILAATRTSAVFNVE
jgi:hypothetical protein